MHVNPNGNEFNYQDFVISTSKLNISLNLNMPLEFFASNLTLENEFPVTIDAGGYGVYVNFLEVFKRFPNAKITVINDSGPLFNDDQAFPICLQFGFSVIFGLPLPTDLVECCGTPDIGLSNVYEYSSKNFPKANYGFMSSYNDATSRFFLSFGYNNCSGAPGNQLPADVFKNALINLREDILKYIPPTSLS